MENRATQVNSDGRARSRVPGANHHSDSYAVPHIRGGLDTNPQFDPLTHTYPDPGTNAHDGSTHSYPSPHLDAHTDPNANRYTYPHA